MSSQLPDFFAFPNCLCASHRAHAAMFMGGEAEQEACRHAKFAFGFNGLSLFSMSPKKSVTLEREKLALKRHQSNLAIAESVAQNVIRWGSAIAIAFFVYKSVGLVAGRETSFKATMDSVFKIEIDKFAGYALSAIFGVTTLRERRLRRREVSDLSAQNKKLEGMIDPRRSSSGLTQLGLPAGKEEK